MIPVFRPYYDEREEEAVINVLRSGWIGLGPVTEQFEQHYNYERPLEATQLWHPSAAHRFSYLARTACDA